MERPCQESSGTEVVDAIIITSAISEMFVGCLFFSQAGVHIVQHQLKEIPNLFIDIQFFQPVGDEVGDVAVTVVPCKACLISEWKER